MRTLGSLDIVVETLHHGKDAARKGPHHQDLIPRVPEIYESITKEFSCSPWGTLCWETTKLTYSSTVVRLDHEVKLIAQHVARWWFMKNARLRSFT